MIVGWGKQTNLSASRTQSVRSGGVHHRRTVNQDDQMSGASQTSQKIKKINHGRPQVKGKAGGGSTDG
ncbi:hypothetical protein [Paenibacillus sp. FSL R7-0652]|jgi:hypothetical protein|uniref:hypothetical protein n=1 Tax=Paenibacillus sp. FSL R7-0652 TaxID=2921687 RepID=UPI00315A34B0